VLVGLFNLGFFIVPCAQVRSNPPLELAVRMQGRWSGPTTVGYGDFNPDNWTLRYFNPATRWVAVEPGNGLAGFRRLLADQQREGRTVWLDSSAVRTLDEWGRRPRRSPPPSFGKRWSRTGWAPGCTGSGHRPRMASVW
jgi:hypothetical protein